MERPLWLLHGEWGAEGRPREPIGDLRFSRDIARAVTVSRMGWLCDRAFQV